MSSHFYHAVEAVRHEIDDVVIPVRSFPCTGDEKGALVLIHGFPTHGYTWRKLLPTLTKGFTCHVVDLPGLGDSVWSDNTDFSFTEQARRLCKLFDEMGLQRYAILAHDTGASIARIVTLNQPQRVSKLAIINTEMPGHRPPWIPFYQLCARLPFSVFIFMWLMRQPVYQRSSLGFRQFYGDEALLNAENLGPYIDPVTHDRGRMQGLMSYLKGIEWKVVDSFGKQHRKIKADVLLLWGEDDRTFPVDRAVEMCRQFRSCKFERLAGLRLLPHEEDPDLVLKALLPFLVH